MLRRLFPTLARATADWPAEKWLAFPTVFFFAFAWLVVVIQAVMGK